MIITAVLLGFSSHGIEELARRDNPGIEPGSRKVLEISGYQMGRAGSLSTLEEDVVIRIGARPNDLGGP